MKTSLFFLATLFESLSFADLSNSVWVPRSLDLPPLSLSEAMAYCESINARLPSAQDFRDLMMAQYNSAPDTASLPDGKYWTSTEHPEGLGVEYLTPEHAFGVTDRAARNQVVCLADL